jgi:hypothetical protein
MAPILKAYVLVVLQHAKKLALFGFSDGYNVAIASSTFVCFVEFITRAFEIEVFGVPNTVLFAIFATIAIDAYYGIRKSVMQSKAAFEMASLYGDGPEYRKLMRTHETKKFQLSKLRYTFFKCFTLLGYLYFANKLLQFDANSDLLAIVGFAGSLVLKVPLTIFWYYDFKSIGENSAHVYGKKAPIFVIIEKLVDLKIKDLKL